MLLSELLDGELPPSEAESVRRHVDTCETCQTWLERLERATAAGRAALAPPRAPTGAPGADCLAPDRLAGWTAHVLPPDEMQVVEAHLAGCAVCLEEAIGAARLMARLDAGPRLPVPPALAARVASRWGGAQTEESLTALVIRIARAGMALVERHVVAPVVGVEEVPVAAVARRAADGTNTLTFRLTAPEAQIRATVVTEGETVGLTLTLLGSADDALGGQRVFLRRHGRSIYSATTDAAGALAMPPLEPGVYEIACPGIGTSFRLDLRP
jgi:anti-sigma factor RsiW